MRRGGAGRRKTEWYSSVDGTPVVKSRFPQDRPDAGLLSTDPLAAVIEF